MVVADSGHVAIEHARPMTSMERRALGRAFSVDRLVMLAGEEMDGIGRETSSPCREVTFRYVRRPWLGWCPFRGRGVQPGRVATGANRGGDASSPHPGERNLERLQPVAAAAGVSRRRAPPIRAAPTVPGSEHRDRHRHQDGDHLESTLRPVVALPGPPDARRPARVAESSHPGQPRRDRSARRHRQPEAAHRHEPPILGTATRMATTASPPDHRPSALPGHT